MYDKRIEVLKAFPKTWLITGVAGFIGSHLLERLLMLDQKVIGIDNFLTGSKINLIDVETIVGAERWENFERYSDTMAGVSAFGGSIDYILHQAALGSVPRSIKDPSNTYENNVMCFIDVLEIARMLKVKRVVYASSSSVYGDNTDAIKIERKIGQVLSPYAASKRMCEIAAQAHYHAYGVDSVGLRYFNVFGPRQDPNGEYAAVIPKWINAALKGKEIIINGDGTTSRDFCYVENIVRANILAATSLNIHVPNNVFNIACGESISLNEVLDETDFQLLKIKMWPTTLRRKYSEPRKGDIKNSQANINKARGILGYRPKYQFSAGFKETFEWYQGRI